MDELHIEPCSKCRGKGVRFYGRGTPPVACNYCKGVGKRQFKECLEKRLATREKAKERKARKLAERIAAYQAEHPAIWEWMHTAEAAFAGKMRDALMKWGGLTDAQHAVALRASAGAYRKARLL